ncbi:UDP-N-acetylglucosamine--N-acetylmuramyl-(pentapeptide) pyrophosphoryl-undecaprenol N-acetylglucosamine transferase [Actinobaculum suis]|uniref:UDP-N-acetylglucosamine--N-acetylmuramyl-(pentapeptide) pyrophosphoryl-undecaprenol N-acetylglucosamine transferase n=1 Tax=Actinobaculum suis TaxID=1657 RepID=A0A7Z9C8T2_9ACTO|nr:undecaprenyldiphospho-muramoylpentapeptide beta-N-acetylglucosaminyltransferase [Actinobaculum suis]VDG76743.1 UDP-N-acetylglucosamine--N-acetylmuramyl-(pentapeptide) pyrophosphoryl-undecaprenol N-acetylglucosamine transferase [Actinobaculum suis]
MALRIVLAGGGTAGHINPMLATARQLREWGHEVTAIGTAEGMESRLVPEAGIPFEVIPRVPFPRRPNADLFRFPVRYPRAIKRCKEILRRTNADVAVGFGGYTSTPLYAAARALKVPFVIHEQNALPGLANRLGARHAAAVCLAFATTRLRARNGTTQFVGLPLRPEIAKLAEDNDRSERRKAAAARFGLDPEMRTVVVTGGSLGAAHINEVVAENAETFAEAEIQVLHLTGRGKDGPVRERVAGYEHYAVLEYLSEMEEAYAVADWVISRAGAGTVSEVCALGIPAMFVPLPIGNGEQALNAKDAQEKGGSLLVKDEEFCAESIALVVRTLHDPEQLERIRLAQRGISPRDGAYRLGRVIEEVAAEREAR